MDTYAISRKAYLMLVVEALTFAKEQETGSAGTRAKIDLALRSARRDLARHEKALKKESPREKNTWIGSP